MLKFQIVGRDNQAVQVNGNGELVVGRVGQVQMHSVDLAVDDQVYNMLKPIPGLQAVIASVSFSGNRSIGANDSIVELYEAESALSAVKTATLIQIEVAKNQLVPFANLDVSVRGDRFLNARCNDNKVFVVFGVYFQTDIGDEDFHRRTKTGIGDDII